MTETRIACGLVVTFFVLGGIAHFAFPASEISIIPPWVPCPPFINALVGACEIAGALGLVLPRTRRLASWCLMALTLAVTPANVYMLQHADGFATIPPWALVLRLPAQLLLLALIYRAGTQPSSPAPFAPGEPPRSRGL